MLDEFKKFISRGNVMDLAVGVIIGGAFALITKSLTDDIIMPLVSWLFGGFDFSGYFVRLGPVPEGYAGSLTNYAELKEAGVLLWGYGQFATVVVNFVILAFIIFLLVRTVNRINMKDPETEAKTPTAPPENIILLKQIRDELKKANGEV
ncbi:MULTISPECIES: large conductance mechanosensitive channel protein MscL [Pacificimonas]|uniref:large conductance mechanosensitive channel protein MscL n=1 Tax=Pacificimonas TaxID=1960290 RepID=UPI001CCD3AC3|nr:MULTISPECIES: large conductance mechanosensitive channel protein MscL [Pacificimonas]